VNHNFLYDTLFICAIGEDILLDAAIQKYPNLLNEQTLCFTTEDKDSETLAYFNLPNRKRKNERNNLFDDFCSLDQNDGLFFCISLMTTP
jgi:hypothetical protein